MKTELTNQVMSENGVVYQTVVTTVEGENNDCTVRALAAVTGSSYEEAHQYASQNWNRQTGLGVDTITMVRDFNSNTPLGHTFVPVGDVEKEIRIGEEMIKIKTPRTFYNNTGQVTERHMTVKTLLDRFPEGSFLVLVRKHAFAVKDGLIIGNPSDAKALRRRVLNLFKVERY